MAPAHGQSLARQVAPSARRVEFEVAPPVPHRLAVRAFAELDISEVVEGVGVLRFDGDGLQ